MAFTGRAIYDSGVFTGVAEDVSEDISLISPSETPLLDRLTQPQRPAQNVLHEWLEESLNPDTVTSSTVVAPAATAIAIHKGGAAVASHIMLGHIAKNQTTGEFVQITGVSGNTITITRGFGGSSAATITAGDKFFLVSEAALEGADVSQDISQPRVRKTNYLQIFKKDIIVSGTMQAVNQLGGIDNEYEHQRMQRITESIRDLEKAVIVGKSSGNTLGSASAYRTMKGLWDHITTNSTSTGTMTADVLDTILQGPWTAGAGDVDLVIVDPAWKRIIDSWNSTRVQVSNTDTNFRNVVSRYTSTFGEVDVVLGRWMPANSLMAISTQRVHVVPLTGRSFQHIPVARTGDSMKGMVIGEYTLEVMNEDGMAKAYG